MMEKSQAQKQNQTQSQETKHKIQKPQEGKQHLVWDCGSTLYDSFELNSFNRQLDSAIHSRTMSMPHLVDSRAPLPPQSTALPPPVSKKQTSKFSRSIQKLFKSMFKFKQSSSSSVLWLKQRSNEEYYVVYDKTGALTTIPEVPEIDFGGLSPEINSLVTKRTASERFTAASTVGISCA
ncbi:hypothetical protein REPUB_Repub08aG0169700 [Reevesia pubescens]